MTAVSAAAAAAAAATTTTLEKRWMNGEMRWRRKQVLASVVSWPNSVGLQESPSHPLSSPSLLFFAPKSCIYYLLTKFMHYMTCNPMCAYSGRNSVER